VSHFLHSLLRVELLIIDFPLIASPLKAAINEGMLLDLLIGGTFLYLIMLSAFVFIKTYWRGEQELPLHIPLLLNTSPFKAIVAEGRNGVRHPLWCLGGGHNQPRMDMLLHMYPLN
jgi:hypothetical protein